MAPEEALELAKRGKKAGCSEALITLGERPEVHDVMKEKLEGWNYSNTVDYLADLSEQILNFGLLPHINPGILDKDELSRLRRWNASMGLMLECATELPAHGESPGKDPKLRLEMIEEAGELKIPFTTGILVGIGESWNDRIESLLKIKELHQKYGHIQEVIVQPFIPKKGTPMENEPAPDHLEILNTLSIAERVMPDTSIQVPPNLTHKLIDFLRAGVDDLGGISITTPDFINPEKPWPNIAELKSRVENAGFELRERLPIYPEFARDSDFMSPEVKEVVGNLSDREGFRRKRA